MRIIRPTVAALVALLLAAAPVLADTIDGVWCSPDNRDSLSIDGPKIVTPGGTAMSGNYDRHGFSYVVPQREPGAGSTVQMVLRSETIMQLTRGDRKDAPETWRRCTQKPVS
jgi:hypothetical protein